MEDYGQGLTGRQRGRRGVTAGTEDRFLTNPWLKQPHLLCWNPEAVLEQ